MQIGWTTVETAPQAQKLAHGLVASRLAACVQVEGPITSTYHWEAKVESTTEYRLTIKFLSSRHAEVESWLHHHHPYDTPQWITVRAEHVAEKYLSWAQANSSSLNL